MIESTIPKELRDLADVQAKVEGDLLARNNVVGVALGHKVVKGEPTKQQALTVLVESKFELDMLRPEDVVPTTIDGVKTDVLEVGHIFAGPAATLLEPPLAELPEFELMMDGKSAVLAPPAPPTLEQAVAHEVKALQLTGRVRPAMGGFSVGHYQITAGTIATACYAGSAFLDVPKAYFLLSNNHVLANCNLAKPGDPILQPGPYDGGKYPADMIAQLYGYVPIRFASGTSYPINWVDAAIGLVNFHDLNREIYYLGYPNRVFAPPALGMYVEKTGRTSNFTTGVVTGLNATVDVNYGGGRVARFAGQIIVQTKSKLAFGAPGDSGSLVLDFNENPVGLLFAGSNVATIVNRIDYVQSLLGVRIVEL